MKKRIESLSNLPKTQKYFYKAHAFDNKKEKHLKHENNHKANTLQKTKDDQPIKKNKQERETYKELIKQMNSPHLKEIRILVCSLIYSADRLEPLAISEQNYVQHYQKDRKRLIDYFNSLVVKQIDLSPSKNHNHGKQIIGLLSPQEQKHLIQEVAEIKNNIQAAIAKKRSKSSLATLHNDFRKQFSLVKAKVKKLQETQCMNQQSELGAFIKQVAKIKPDSKSKTNLQSTQFLQDNQSKELQVFEKKIQTLKSQMCIQQQQKERILATLAYVQVLIFKSKQILSEVIEYGQNEVLKKFQKEYIQVTMLALDEGLQQCKFNKAKNDALLKLKHEAQSTIKSLCQCRKRVFLLLREKEDLQKKLNDQKQAHSQQEGYYEQLQEKINKLNCEMGDLVQEVEKKEELVQYLKVESQNLKEDIRSLEQMLNQSRMHYQALTQELTDSGQRLKAAQEQINELMTEMQSRNRQLISKLQEIQKRDEQIHSLKLDINTKEQQAMMAIKNAHQQKMLVQFSKQQLESELKQHKHTIKFLAEQRTILQQKIQQVLTHEQDLKQRIATLQQQFQLLEKENQQLYKDIRGYQHSQSSSQETVQQLIQSNKNLNEEISSLKSGIIEDHKKIKFYQQKLVELATLADTTEYEILIENQQRKIIKLQQRIKQLENPQGFKQNEDIIDQQIQSLTNQRNSLEQIQSQSKQYPHQNQYAQQYHLQGKLSQQDQISQQIVLKDIGVQKIEIDKDNNHLHIEDDHLTGGNSVLSLYEIKIINQNQDTVDTHKALHRKEKGQQILISEEIDSPSQEKQSHNSIFETKQIDPQIYRISHKQISPKCSSQSSNKVNLDFEFSNQQKQMVELEGSQIKKKLDLSNSIKRIPDLIMADSSFKDQSEFASNIRHQFQAMPQPQIQEKKRSQEKLSQINSKKTEIKPRNIYIMLGKKQERGNSKGDSVHRSKSCFQVQL